MVRPMALQTASDPNFFKRLEPCVRSHSLRLLCHLEAHGTSLNRATRSLGTRPHSLRNVS
jgi:hypothetical protein